MAKDMSQASEDERIILELQAELLKQIRGGSDCGPFMAAVYDRDGNCLSRAFNTVVGENCSHCHAEMNAIRLVEEKFATWNLAPRNLVLYGVPSDRVEAIAGFDEGFKPNWKAEFVRRGIEVVGPLAVEKGEEVFRECMRFQRTVYVPRAQEGRR